MRTTTLLCTASLLVCLASHIALAGEEGFVPLFNGKDLTGWKESGKPGSFTVKDGVIVGKKGKDTAYLLSTEKKYGDFVLRLEYRLAADGNSGVFVRVPHFEGRSSREGMEIQLQDDKGKEDKHKPAQRTGAIYGAVPPTRAAARGPGEWNTLEILCQGDRIQVTLNNVVVNDLKMSEHEALRKRPREGFICLSAHTNVVELKNARLKELR